MTHHWVINEIFRIIFLTLGFIWVARQSHLELVQFLKVFLIALLAAIVAPFWVWFQLKEFEGSVHGSSVSYAFLGVFAVMSLYWHRDRLVSRINEGTVLLLTLSFEFFLLSSGTEFGKTVAIWTSPFAVFTILQAYTKIQIGFWIKVVLMVWFCLMSMILGMRQFIVLASEAAQLEGRWSGYLALFLLSSIFLQLIASASLLLSLAPGKIKQGRVSNQTRKQIAFVTGLMSHKQVSPALALLATFLFVAPVALNEWLQWVPRELAYSATLTLTPIYSGRFWKSESTTSKFT